MRKVLVDTNIWSAFLRKSSDDESVLRSNLFRLVEGSKVCLIGPIRQEVLSGVRDQTKFDRLVEYLEGFEDEEIATKDYEDAARLSNRCASKGIAASAVDLLIVAFAVNRNFEVYTRDKDFLRYQSVAPLSLYEEV